jgi:hypothetical protein
MDRSFQSSPLLSALYNRSAIFGVVPNISLKNPLIRIQFQIHLNHADVMVAEKMAHAFTSDLHRKEGHYGHTSENWSINLTTVKFAGSFSLLFNSIKPPKCITINIFHKRNRTDKCQTSGTTAQSFRYGTYNIWFNCTAIIQLLPMCFYILLHS